MPNGSCGGARAEELSDRLEEVAEENAALYERQRQVAEQLQRSLMPRTLPRLRGLEAIGRYQAGIADTEVGGDWYDVVPLSDSRLAFSVGDVCGRGLAAAALMASLRYSIRAYALEQSDPAAILDKLSAMVETTTDDVFATVICGTFDAASGVLTLASAGHFAPLVVEGHRARYLDVPLGPPVGVQAGWAYEAATVRLADDAVLLAFTDGLVERRGEHLDEGLERLRVAAESELPIAELVSHVVDVLGDADANDDTAVLGLHWTRTTASPITSEYGPSSESVELRSTTDAPAAARQFLRDTLETSALNGAGEVVALLASEVVTNAVQHAGSSMQLRVIRGSSSIRVEVDDESEKLPERQNPDLAAERGRGILLVDSLATAWGVDYRDVGKTVWFEVDISTPTVPPSVADGSRTSRKSTVS